MARVVVVGAGIAGLAAALRIRALAPGVEVEVLEASTRAGGLVRTERVDGFTIDRGPESILTDKPAAMATIAELGLEPRLVRTQAESRGAYVVAQGRLQRIPEGFQLLAPTDLRAWLRTPYVSLPGRLRALLDLVLPSRAGEDETLGSFVERRFGRELLDRLAQPLASGIYGAHPDVLGLAATMPRFLAAEREHGSVIRGLRARPAGSSAHGARYGLFVNFDQGMQVLPDAMAAALAGRIRFGASLRAIERADVGFELRLDDGSRERADALVIAVGGPRSAALVGALDPALAARIAGIRHGSGAIVTLAFERGRIAHPLDAYGYVTPIVEGHRVTASTWLSRKWPGRAPAGMELLRFFVGRDGDDAVVELDDDALLGLVRRDAQLLGLEGEPALARIDRWREAMPRYGLHHLREVEAIERGVAAIPGLALAGNAYRGVGIPDSIASGERAARAALAHLGIRDPRAAASR